jgi:hypothetical protein
MTAPMTTSPNAVASSRGVTGNEGTGE